MTNIKMKSWLLASMLMTSGAVQAESLAQLYQLTLQQDPVLQAAEAARQAAAEVIPQRQAALLPSLSASASTQYRDSKNGGTNWHDYGLSLRQPLYNRASWLGYQQGKQLDASAALQLEQAQQQVLLRVVEAYLEALRARMQLQTAEAEEQAILRRLEQNQAQFDVGLIAITDVEEARAAYQRAQVSRIQAANLLENNLEALARLAGQPIQVLFELAADYPLTDVVPDLDTVVEQALANNLDLQRQRLAVESAQTQTKISSAGHLPTVDLTASAGGADQGNGMQRLNTVGVTLSMPLYAGGAVQSGVRESQARLTQQQAEQENLRRQVQLQARTLVRNLQADVATIEAQRLAIQASETALKATEAGYEVGTRNIVDVLESQKNLFQSQRNYADARYNLVLNQLRLQELQGQLAVADLQELDRWLLP
ncbi:TolC family outer membrane protein [Balneatrix alpica]|uniref:TolC family outer membrane protein n=1 Tax=Balneatrix alpica TaxID=75684 RepID=A0ABV5ZBD1_9GAMM|nr:TolC family outer membrane protein [Balneatrix alpica]